MVAMFDVVKLNKLEDLPHPTVPYFVMAEEALYLHKDTAIGNALIPEKKMHSSFKSMGQFKNGYFHFRGPKIPRTVIAQAYRFFREVFNKRKSEAEVFILRKGTDDFKLFVPYQVATHSGVDSIYDDTHIPEDYMIIGTIHSHCDFSAFHSGTDDADASDFNGLHITIGHVDTNRPSFAAMVMINKLKFEYDLSVVTEIDDDTEFGDEGAFPENWFSYFYDDPEEILKLDLPSLTDADKKEFLLQVRGTRWLTAAINNNTSKITPVPKGKKKEDRDYSRRAWWLYDDDDDWGISPQAREYKQYLTDTHWNPDFRRSYPKSWFVPGSNSKLTVEGAERALTEELGRLFDIASNYGIYLEYEMLNMYEVEK